MKIKSNVNIECDMTMEDIIGQMSKDMDYKFAVRDGIHIVNKDEVNIKYMMVEHTIEKEDHIQKYLRDNNTDSLYCLFYPSSRDIISISRIPNGEKF
jgi:ribosome-interacting GTPase 1